MTHWRQTIEKDYLGAHDLVGKDDKPRDYTLEISAVSSVALKTRETPKGKRKCVVSFKGAEKKMVCNTTNCELIESMYGPQIEGWVGKRITLYQGDVRNPKGGMTKGVKVRPKVPSGKAESIASVDMAPERKAELDEAFDRGDNPDEH